MESVEYSSAGSGLPDIDEDPFAHFITPITEEDDPFDGLELNAGIFRDQGKSSKTAKFKSSVAQKWTRYVQNNHSNLHSLYHDSNEADENNGEEESFMQLDDERLIDTPHTVVQLSRPHSPSTSSSPTREATRGRAQELLSPNARRRYRQSRTLSGRRHSWRQPSPDIFTVMEAAEEPDMSVEYQTKDGAEHRRSHAEVVAERARL